MKAEISADQKISKHIRGEVDAEKERLEQTRTEVGAK
jgi:hypothetical protein